MIDLKALTARELDKILAQDFSTNEMAFAHGNNMCKFAGTWTNEKTGEQHAKYVFGAFDDSEGEYLLCELQVWVNDKMVVEADFAGCPLSTHSDIESLREAFNAHM